MEAREVVQEGHKKDLDDERKAEKEKETVQKIKNGLFRHFGQLLIWQASLAAKAIIAYDRKLRLANAVKKELETEWQRRQDKAKEQGGGF